MENENGMVATAENVEKETSQPVKEDSKEKNVESEKTFTRDEVNKMINAERAKERESVLKEVEARKAEAQKLAEMDELQKKDYEIEQLKKELAKRDDNDRAVNLEKEALKQAREKGIDLDLMGTIDYSRETAESLSAKMEVFAATSRKIQERAISDYSKEPTPQTGDRPSVKTLGECKTYEDFEEYYKNHPNESV